MKTKAMDLSAWNVIKDYKELKKNGVDRFVLKIIRKDFSVDKSLVTHLNGGKSADIECLDFYNYSYANSKDKATQSANAVIDTFKQYVGNPTKDYTIWIDIEDDVMSKLGNSLSGIINTYQDVIESAGFSFGIYTSLDFYNAHIRSYIGSFKCKKWWIARYYNGGRLFKFDTFIDEKYNPKNSVGFNLYGWRFTNSFISTKAIEANVGCSVYYGSDGNNNVESRVIVDKVNVMNQPNSTGKKKVVEVIKKGTLVFIEEYKNRQFRIDRTKWIPVESIKSNTYGTVKVIGLNLRDNRDKNSEVVHKMDMGTEVEIYNKYYDKDSYMWMFISNIGHSIYGWASGSLIEVKE